MTVTNRLAVFVAGAIGGTGAIILSLLVVSPMGIGPLGVTVWFIVFFLTLSCIAVLGLYGLKTYLRIHTAQTVRLRYSQRQGMLVSALLTGTLAMSSLKQLGFVDVILLGLILVIIEVYVRFRWP